MSYFQTSLEPQGYQRDKEEVHTTLHLLPNPLLLPAAAAATLLSLPIASLPQTKLSNLANLVPAPTCILFTLKIIHGHRHPTRPLKPSATDSSTATYPCLALPSQSWGGRAEDNLIPFADQTFSTGLYIDPVPTDRGCLCGWDRGISVFLNKGIFA